VSPRRAWVRTAMQRYWPGQAELIAQLPMPVVELWPEAAAPVLSEVLLPAWAQDLGVAGRLLVPAAALVASDEPQAWRRCDWLSAAIWFLDALAERAHETRAGPLHSYAARLHGWDERLWSHAWVNRMALFLRRWAARHLACDETQLFGALPAARVVLTHDVDALAKTTSIRLKQSMFQAFNTLRALRDGDFAAAAARARQFLTVLTSRESYWCFERIFALEEAAGVQSMFFFHARERGLRSPQLQLLDPAYHSQSATLARAVALVRQHGATIGLHPSFGAWRDADALQRERMNLEALSEMPVTSVRQHWLRFSWQDTWAAQARAGLCHDFTVAFNDRPGFRLGAALTFQPFAMQANSSFLVTPTVMMDSQFYDYAELSVSARAAALGHWLRELTDTGGEGAVIWHQQVFNRDYGWQSGYETLLDLLRAPA
jgi:hypothetical protein